MDTPVIVAIIMAASAVIGASITYISTRGRTKTDAKAALDARIDERVKGQLEGAWKEIDSQSAQISGLRNQNKGQAKQIAELRAHAEISERREVLIYQHTRALRNHILNELPPPPPAMPLELMRWFVQQEAEHPPTGEVGVTP